MTLNVFELIQNPFFLVFCLFILVALLYAFRGYIRPMITALAFDALDAGLSFADNFLGGVGLAGVDIGDWVAGLWILLAYRKQVGNFWAFIFLLEAANFIVFSFLPPPFGESIELFFSAVPIVSIVIFWKQSQANQLYYPVKEYAAYLRDENVGNVQEREENIKAFEKEYSAGNYEKIKEEGRVLKDDLFAAVRQHIMEKLSRAQQFIITTLQKEVQMGTGKIHEQDITMLSGAIQQATRDIETDWKLANNEANQILQSVSSLVYQVGKEETETKERDDKEEFKQAA